MAAEIKVTLMSWDVSGGREGGRERVGHKPDDVQYQKLPSKGSQGPKGPAFPWNYVNVGPSVLLTNRLLVLVLVPAPPRLITGAGLYL